MPICPGCERSVAYDRLDLHERYCGGIWGEPAPAPAVMERIERRLQRLEAELDRQVAGNERTRGSLRQ